MGMNSIAAILALRLEPTTKHVATLLAYHRNDVSGRCDPSVACLAQESGLCERTIQKHLRALCDHGVIEISPRAGRSSLYHLDLRSTCGGAGHAEVHNDTPTPAPHARTPAPHAPKQEEQERRASFSPLLVHPPGLGGENTSAEPLSLADRLHARQARLFAQGRNILSEWTQIMSEHEESAVWAAIDALPPQQRWPSQVRHLLAPQVPPPAASMDFDTIAESLCESHQRPAWRRWEFPSMTQGTPDDVSQLSISALDAYATPPQAEASALQTAARQTPAFGAPS